MWPWPRRWPGHRKRPTVGQHLGQRHSAVMRSRSCHPAVAGERTAFFQLRACAQPHGPILAQLAYCVQSGCSFAFKNTPADSSSLRGCQTWGCFWVFAAGYSIANPQWEAHSLSSVVLPKPAGAETSVSLRVTPSFSRSVRRGRETNSARTRGT